MKTFINLFCGIGGFRLALENCGLTCIFSSEIDEKARQSYQANFGEKPAGDITEIYEADIPPHDILCAGFPCQPFSMAGRKLAQKDSRGTLFNEILRIAHYHKPKILLLENVRNIMNIDNGAMGSFIFKELNKIGYNIDCVTLNSSNFGIPQARSRIYFVCLRKDVSGYFTAPQETFKPVYLEDILLPSEQCRHLIKIYKNITLDTSKKENTLNTLMLGDFGNSGQGQRIYSPKGHACTILPSNHGLYFIDGHIRRLHVIEAKRLMGFPDNYTLADGKTAYRQLGNSVIPAMIELLYRHIYFTKKE